MSKFMTAQWARLKAASGMVSSGQGVDAGTLESGPGAIVVSALIGAFLGLIAGLIINHLVRFLSMTCNRSFGGYGWVIYATLLGAVTCALLAINNDKN